MSEEEVLAPINPPEEKVDIPKKKGGFLGKLVAFLLGILFGIASLSGTIFYLVSYVKIKNATDFIGGFAGFKFDDFVEKDYVSESLGGETAMQIIFNLGYAAQQKELLWFCEYFPVLEEYIDEFVNNINEGFGIKAETSEVITTPVADLPTYFSDLVKDAPLGDVMKATSETGELDDLMMELSYGHEGEDYYIDENGEVVMIAPAIATTIGMMSNDSKTALNKILLSHVIKEKQDNQIIMYLLYGKKDIEYKLVPDPDDPTKKVAEMQQMQIAVKDGKVYDFYGEEMEKDYTWDEATKTYTDKNGVAHIIDKPVQKDGINSTVEIAEGVQAPLYYVKDAEGEPIKFKATTVGDMAEDKCHLTTLTERMTLGEILGEDKIKDNKILKHLSDSPIEKIPTAIDSLTFGEVFESDIYVTYEEDTPFTDVNGQTINKGDYIYYPVGSTDPCKATSPEQYELKGTWKYMLKDETGDKAGLDYSITNDMNKIMDNMSANMKTATLRELNNDKIISMDAASLENKQVPNDPSTHGELAGKKLGDLTVSQMLTVTTRLIP